MKKLNTLISEAADLTKDQLIDEGKRAAEEITEDGFNDAAPLIINARKAIEFLTSFSRALESQATDEISLQDNKEVSVGGATIGISSTGDRLNFKLDAVWLDLSTKLKAREALLKIARKDPGSIRDADGFNVPTLPLSSAGKTVLRVKL